MEEINKGKIFEAIEQIALQNPLSEEETKEIITNAVIKGFHSKYDPDANLELVINKDKKIFKLFNNSKLVVDDNEYEDKEEYNAIEIPLKKAKIANSNIKVGDFIRAEVDFSLYSRSITQQIKQIFTQTIREKKKEAIFAKHKGLKDEMINVTVSSVTPTFIIFQLDDGTTAFMPSHLRNPNISLTEGQKSKVYVEDVLEDSKDAQIIVSNGSKQLIKRILEEEVPELASGTIEIVEISRQPGVRSKVAVKSNNQDVDPVGTIIGANGNRIKAVLSRLDGEKLDIILYSNDINIFVANSLSPAKVASVIDKRDNDDNIIENQKIAIVPNNQLTLAIGKKGSNARLSVELTKTRVDVISIEQATEKEIDIVYNVSLTEDDVKQVEMGININSYRNSNRNNENANNMQINNNEFDSSIETFKESIVQEKSQTQKFDVDENMFSDEELKEMEVAFEHGDDLEDVSNNKNEDFEF